MNQGQVAPYSGVLTPAETYKFYQTKTEQAFDYKNQLDQEAQDFSPIIPIGVPTLEIFGIGVTVGVTVVTLFCVLTKKC